MDKRFIEKADLVLSHLFRAHPVLSFFGMVSLTTGTGALFAWLVVTTLSVDFIVKTIVVSAGLLAVVWIALFIRVWRKI